MLDKRVLLLLSSAAVLLAVSFAAQTPFNGIGSSSTETGPIADAAFWDEPFAAEPAAAGGRRVCYDRFEDPRPYCRGCCGSWGRVRKWGECCMAGEETNCYERFCDVGPPVQPAPDVACMLPASELPPAL